MSEAKITIKIGQIEFSGQGAPEWVAKQLDKILAQAEKLIHLAPEENNGEGNEGKHNPMGKDSSISKVTLPAFLTTKAAKTNQNKKFLATATWLEAKGKSRLETGDISKALRESSQTKINNPSLSLTHNVSKGFCEKEGKQFFVTEEGKNSL